ncbi:MAG TPA: hypothetical protein VIC06_14595 [Solirubrobacteraceae bacterium]
MSDDPVVDPPAPVVDPPAPGAETVTMTKAEADALKRQVAEANKAQRKLEADQQKAEDERQRKQGEWQQLAEQKDQELAEERAQSARVKREERIGRIANRMKFLDPADVKGRITPEDGEDDSTVEAALARIAEQSPHLIAKEAPGAPEIGRVLDPTAVTPVADGTPKPPPGKAPLASLADVQKLTEHEINERWDEVAAVMQSGR